VGFFSVFKNYLNQVIGCLFGMALVCAPLQLAAETIKIGAVFGLSGGMARYGQWASNGASLAAEKLNSAGGAQARQVELVFEDNQGQAALAVSAFQKLLSLQKIKLVLTYQSSIALAIAPLANRAEVVQMDVSAFSPAYSSPDDFTFRTGILAADLAEAAARIIFDKFEITNVGVFYIENEKGLAGYQAFRDAYKGKIAFAESFAVGETDYRSVLLRAKAVRLQDVWVTGHFQETGLLVKQAAELGLKLRVFSDVYSVEGLDFLQSAGAAAEGLIYSAPQFESSQEPQVVTFRREYQARFAEQPAFLAAQAYDGMWALGQALQLCEAVTAECVKEKLYQLSFQGASGLIRFDRDGDVRGKAVEIRTIRGGKFVDYVAGGG
jgi:branched-chain amino acid transport system substrate-binding protein